MKLGVLREIVFNERRVALVPRIAGNMVKAGYEVLVQAGAGNGALTTDREYEEAGATLLERAEDICREADVVLKVQRPITDPVTEKHETEMMREGTVLISFLIPHEEMDLLDILAEKRVSAFSMNLIPRITRAQTMDALTSQATVAGYQAAVIGACTSPRFFPMLTTAAGTIAPARVLVLGAGVAGLHAIATARRLGADVEAFDIRPAVKEEVESLGAKFVDVSVGAEETEDEQGYAKEISEEEKKREQAVLTDHVRAADVVITTAMVPGKPAPILVTEEMLKGMRPGSVIVDVAAESGGNCELTQQGKWIHKHGVVICGPLNLPSMMPFDASSMYAKNITSFLALIVKEGELNIDFEDEIVREACLTHDGRVLFESELSHE